MFMIRRRIVTRIQAAAIIIVLTLSVILWAMPPASAINGPMVGPRIDVKITNITFSDDVPVEDEEIIISAVVLNNGSRPVSNVTITFAIDGEELGNTTGITMVAKESLIVNCTWTAEKWEHNVAGMVSIDNMPLQNAVFIRTISVEAKPVGDVPTLIYALFLFMVVILITAIFPSIFVRLKR